MERRRRGAAAVLLYCDATTRENGAASSVAAAVRVQTVNFSSDSLSASAKGCLGSRARQSENDMAGSKSRISSSIKSSRMVGQYFWALALVAAASSWFSFMPLAYCDDSQDFQKNSEFFSRS